MLVVATGLSQAANDKQQITPMVWTLGALPEALDDVSELLGRREFARALTAACGGLDGVPIEGGTLTAPSTIGQRHRRARMGSRTVDFWRAGVGIGVRWDPKPPQCWKATQLAK